MSLFRKIFGSKLDKSQDHASKDNRGKYMPDLKLPIDERFTINFKANGGKFLYCENIDEVNENLKLILDENNWNGDNVMMFDENLAQIFKTHSLNISNSSANCNYFLSTCEYLISNDGTILLSSNQIGEQKIINLPENFILIARTSQIVKDKRDALHGINWGSQTVKPTNISTIKYFDLNIKSDDILKNYGNSNSKNLYLLLLEDL